MTLKEKLHKIYSTIDAIEKRGESTALKYKYIKAADVTNAIRKQLTDLKVYAEINFDFVGVPFTIARAKDKDAPFTAVLVKCSVQFHDLESNEILTGSGLGTGADTGDKAAYKAQTGALKYALKNAFLVPDEPGYEADPEADPTVDEGREPEQYPDFQEARHAAPKAVTPKPPMRIEIPTAAPKDATETPQLFGAPDAAAPSPTEPVKVAGREPGEEEAPTMPTEEEMNIYRQRFTELADELSAKGKLTASKGLKLNTKLRVFLQQIEHVDTPTALTKAQWDDFFHRVDVALATPEVGLTGLSILINKANGIEPKK